MIFGGGFVFVFQFYFLNLVYRLLLIQEILPFLPFYFLIIKSSVLFSFIVFSGILVFFFYHFNLSKYLLLCHVRDYIYIYIYILENFTFVVDLCFIVLYFSSSAKL